MGIIRINGVIVSQTSGRSSLSISASRVFVDGKDVTPDAKQVQIHIEGNIETLQVDACEKVSVSGNAGSVRTISGDVDVSGNVLGSISSISGDIDCTEIKGSVSTVSGNVKHRR